MQHIHIIGIAGIGMSGIARLLRHRGYTVSGCDASAHDRYLSPDIPVTHHNSHVCHAHDIDAVVYSHAIPEDHAEIVSAQQKHIPVFRRRDIIPYLTDGMYVIAVTGTHGKTTTTAFIGHILTYAGCDPHVLVGGHVTTWNSNVRLGSHNTLVIEADESDMSLLAINPDIAVLTNIDFDHSQTYADMSHTIATFQQFMTAMSPQSHQIMCIDDPNTCAISSNYTNAITYGFTRTADYQCTQHTSSHAVVAYRNTSISITPSLPGRHNMRNTLGAIAACHTFGLPKHIIRDAIEECTGISRRFELKQYVASVPVYDDYAHHPEEIRSVCDVLRECHYQHPCVIFQPHRYSRCASLWNDFLHAFTLLHTGDIVITDIYSAGEPAVPRITAEQFVQELRTKTNLTVIYIPHLEHLTSYVTNTIHQYDVCITLGAGDITKIHSHIEQHTSLFI